MEVLIVIAVIAAIAAFTTAVDSSSVNRANVNAESNTLIELLVHARSQSMSNQNETTHGVHITDTEFILFEGVYGSGSEQSTSRNTEVTGGNGNEVIFDQLTGKTTANSLTLTGPSKSVTININSEGRISW
jgi:Tfp pilus assembly protein FimT